MESLVWAECFNEIFSIFPIELELKCSDFSDYFISFIAACGAMHKRGKSTAMIFVSFKKQELINEVSDNTDEFKRIECYKKQET